MSSIEDSVPFYDAPYLIIANPRWLSAPEPTQIGVRFTGVDKLVHLIGLGEVVKRLGRGLTEHIHRPVLQVAEKIINGSHAISFTLHLFLFSHAPQTQDRKEDCISDF